MDIATASTDPWLCPAAEVAHALGADLHDGLDTTEVRARQAHIGPNEITAERPVPGWRRFLDQFRDPVVYLLLAAIAISLVAWLAEGAGGVPVDALVIAAIVTLNAVIGFAQQARAAQAVELLRRMSATTATVVRAGVQVRVPTRDLVPGDLVVLAEGDTVPADARLVSAAALTVSEAALTGESEPVLKDPATLPRAAALGDRLNMVFNGTAVARGVGRAVVTATGMRTEMGQVADLLHATREEPTPLQREIARVGRMLGVAVVVIAVVVVVAVVVVIGVDSVADVVNAMLLAVSLAVAAVPEGLPTILSVVLALGVQRMAAHHAIVKRLSSVETLGAASVICSDKTGTLTRGEMTISRIVTALGEVEVTGAGYEPTGALLHDGRPVAAGEPTRIAAEQVLAAGCLANNARLVDEAGQWTVQGDPTEAAFLVAEAKLGLAAGREARYRRVGEIPFSSERRLMTSLHADAHRDGAIAVATKGAPDVLLDRCAHVQVGPDLHRVDQAWRERILADVDRLSGQGFRTLAVAHQRLASADLPALEDVETALVYLGMVGISDPPRSEAAQAVAEAQRAGVRVVMITGDHPRTAARVARDLGIVDAGSRAVSGAELDALDDAGFARTVRQCNAYARVTPRHKLLIVDALQADGHVVAMTGDGVNDAPALRSADIGVAMGSGTEVTKEAAAMILADDDFATIVRAVREGRGIFQNIRRFLRYLLSSNMAEVLTVLLGVLMAGALGLAPSDGEVVLPLLATQILWINLLTDSAPALAIGVDPVTGDVMDRPPRRRTDRVIDARMWRGVLLLGAVMAVATLAALDLNLPGGLLAGDGTPDEARTAAFTVLVLAQLFNAFTARSETASAFRRAFSNHWLWAAVLLSAALQVAVVHLPVLNHAFSTVPLSGPQWALCVALASSVLWVGELRKLLLRHGRPGPARA